MKTIKYFVLKNFDEKPILMPNGNDASMREVLLAHIGGAQIKDGKRAIIAYAIGQRLYNLEEQKDFILEDEELNVLKEAVGLNPAQNAVVWGQLWQYLNSVE